MIDEPQCLRLRPGCTVVVSRREAPASPGPFPWPSGETLATGRVVRGTDEEVEIVDADGTHRRFDLDAVRVITWPTADVLPDEHGGVRT